MQTMMFPKWKEGLAELWFSSLVAPRQLKTIQSHACTDLIAPEKYHCITALVRLHGQRAGTANSIIPIYNWEKKTSIKENNESRRWSEHWYQKFRLKNWGVFIISWLFLLLVTTSGWNSSWQLLTPVAVIFSFGLRSLWILGKLSK